MNNISSVEEENFPASGSAEENVAGNAKEIEGVTPAKKAAKKKTSKVTAKPAKVDQPVAVKVPAKKITPKKVSVKKVETVAPKAAKTDKAPPKKQATTSAPLKEKPAPATPKAAKRARTKTPPAIAEPVKETQPLIIDEEAAIEPAVAEQVQEITPSPASNESVEAEPLQEAMTVPSSLNKITFQINFHTVVGEALYVMGDHPLLGNNAPENAFPLSFLNTNYWVGTVEIPGNAPLTGNISYSYVLKNTDGTTSVEWGTDKVIKIGDFDNEEIILVDTWNPSSLIENTYYTEPFREVLLRSNFTEIESATPETVTHIFRAKAPLLAKGQVLCLVGSIAELGEWNPEKPLLLSRQQGEIWHSISLDLSNGNFPFSYKYGLFDTSTNTFIQFESGSNRVLHDGTPDKLTIVSDGFAAIPNNGYKGAGVAIPVFSLRSAKSFGVGEFSDLKLMVDWAKLVGLKLVQLLPVNDTTATHTFTDSYPYAAISAFALHPLYLHLPSIVNKENQHFLTDLAETQEELNAKPEVDYVAVMRAKWDILKQVFPTRKEVTFKSAGFHAFFNENAHWLIPYAAFSYFREQNKTADFNQWKSDQTYNAAQVHELAGTPLQADDEIGIYYYVQYHLHLQLKEATNYAHENGIIVKGDIPIGIYRNSCDAWQEPDLFFMDMQAGAPPDDFAVKGQNWGFPTYNWQRMREDGFSWWKKRFNQMSLYFDAFRIDHILGFFRIWSIPMNAVEGIMGHFVPALPVHINEITSRGISFNFDRFCKPYINNAVLHEFFGDDFEAFIWDFIESSPEGSYRLKSAFDTQRKVESYFASREDIEQNRLLKQGLYDLISNVILFEEGSGQQQFHFRIAMADTPSFKHLDGHTKHHLYELYINYFFRRQDNYWMKEAMTKLPELKRSTNMLICGEDLGMVPDCVPGVMKELAILSLEIQRMPKDPTREFFHPDDAPYLSVVTPSTHDMSTIRGWWEEDRAATQRFFNSQLGQWGTAPYFCEPWINRIIILQHLYSPAMWSIFQLQDLLGISGTLRRENPNEERINVPANPKHYWRYRMHIPLEDLLNEAEFTAELRGHVSKSGR